VPDAVRHCVEYLNLNLNLNLKPIRWSVPEDSTRSVQRRMQLFHFATGLGESSRERCAAIGIAAEEPQRKAKRVAPRRDLLDRLVFGL